MLFLTEGGGMCQQTEGAKSAKGTKHLSNYVETQALDMVRTSATVCVHRRWK
eukprot:SAG31_NODE_25385_length_462_cov_0.997245_1_plen_51_part_10